MPGGRPKGARDLTQRRPRREKVVTRTCTLCGEEFQTSRGKTTCPRCRHRSGADGRPWHSRVCEACGAPFSTRDANRRRCHQCQHTILPAETWATERVRRNAALAARDAEYERTFGSACGAPRVRANLRPASDGFIHLADIAPLDGLRNAKRNATAAARRIFAGDVPETHRRTNNG